MAPGRTNLQGRVALILRRGLVQPEPCKLVRRGRAAAGCSPAAQPTVLSGLCFQPHAPAAHLHRFCFVLALPLRLFSSLTHRKLDRSSDSAWCCQFSSVHSVISHSLKPHGPQHARPPCPSPTLGVYTNSCPLSW